MRRTLAALLALVALSSTGCFFRKKKVQPPTAQPPAVRRTPPKPVLTEPPPAPAVKETPGPAIVTETPKVAPPKPKQPRRRVTPAAVVPKKETPPPVQAAPAPAPQLGQVLTEQQKAQYKSMYEKSFSATRDLLAKISNRALAAHQQEAAGRIRSFLDQAQEMTSVDWARAAELAHRAELLAQDLIRTLQ